MILSDGKIASPGYLRRLLKNYDDGLLTEGEVDGIIFRQVVEQIVNSLTKGFPVIGFTSWCASKPPGGPIVVQAEIQVGEAEIRITPGHYLCRECQERSRQ